MADHPIDWQAWIARHGPAALLYARQITSRRADAEDAVHDGFVRFWQCRASGRNEAALFFTCVRSAALDLRRGSARRRVREQAYAQEIPIFDGPADATDLRELIEAALQNLPEPQREAVVLKTWCDLTFAQVAEILGESPNTIATRYRLAMEKLEAFLTAESENET